MTPTPKPASGVTPRQDAAEQAKPQEAAGPYVLNLTSSTTPMALSNPEQAELKRFSFFVSRRFEEGRERFRLHMGYFATLAEAEEWLSAVRDIYPGAWAGEAPGKKLRERAAAAAAAQAQHAAGPPPPAIPTARQPSAAPPPRQNVTNVPGAQRAPVDAPVLNVPTVHAATPRAAAPAAPAKPAFAASRPPLAAPATAPSVIGMMRTPKAVPAPKATPVAPVAAPRSTAPLQARSGVPVRAMTAAPTAAPRPTAAAAGRSAIGAGGATGAAPTPAGVRAAQPASTAASAHQQPSTVQGPATRALAAPVTSQRPNPKAPKVLLPNSNVREVLKALDEPPGDAELTGQTRMMAPAPPTGADSSIDDSSFSDTQVLKFLETRRADGTELAGVDVESGAISLLKPDDTGTRRALKQAVTDNAPVWFAVQLQWSVQAVELSKVPPLAIFSAYTLYTVEGSRDGRKWFGLRLGFFSDAISAKQVAYYVRSEFTSVAVVPVSPQERTRASDADKKGEIAFPRRTRSGPVDEFKLIDSDDQPQLPAQRPVATKPAAPAKTASVSSAGRRKGNRVRAREARSPQTLEETLEILGASQLEMDHGNGETMNESGVRHLRVEVQKNTPFGRLLERLSERVRKP